MIGKNFPERINLFICCGKIEQLEAKIAEMKRILFHSEPNGSRLVNIKGIRKQIDCNVGFRHIQ